LRRDGGRPVQPPDDAIQGDADGGGGEDGDEEGPATAVPKTKPPLA
jgi:hypothetical protein